MSASVCDAMNDTGHIRVLASCSVGRKTSMSRRTLQMLNRAAAKENLRAAAPLFSFKGINSTYEQTPATIAAASREQAARLYNGPTVRMAGGWEAQHDTPGPQAYNEGKKWQDKFRNPPSVCIAIAKCERDIIPPRAPGPGDYDIAHPAVGETGNAIAFGDPVIRRKYPPRTPDRPRAEVPCSYAEHVSCLDHQVTSDRVKAPAFCFSGVPRFQERPETRERGPKRKVGTDQDPRVTTKAPVPRPRAVGHAMKSLSRRGKKRRQHKGGPRVFRRGDYGWLASCIEPKQWEPTLNLLGSSSCPAMEGQSTSRALIEKEAPRPVLQRGRRNNPSQYNPLRRGLPREKDMFPGPKYDRPPGAFGRPGSEGGIFAPSASVSSLDRFPLGRLFPEEEMREREATPGPEYYNVTLGHRLEGAALEEMQSAVETLTSWDALGAETTGDWPPALHASNGEGEDGTAREAEQRDFRSRTAGEGAGSRGKVAGDLGGMAQGTACTRSRAPCPAGSSTRRPLDRPLTTSDSRRRGRGYCSRLSAVSSAVARRGVPCQHCLGFEVDGTASAFVAAASSLSDPNLYRRAKTTGASVRFGDMPQQRRAPAYSIGRGARDTSSRLLHSPGEAIYKEDRLGRSGLGPTTATPGAGEHLTRPRPLMARVVPPITRCGATGTPPPAKASLRSTTVVPEAVAGEAVGAESSEGGVVDGALGNQVKSGRPTGPSATLAGPRRADTLFHERLRYSGKELSPAERERVQPKVFFNAHIPDSVMAK